MRPFDLFIDFYTMGRWTDQLAYLPIEMQFYISVMFLDASLLIYIKKNLHFWNLIENALRTDKPTNRRTDSPSYKRCEDASKKCNQNLAIAKIFNFWVFCPIWTKFGIGAYNGPKIIWNESEMPTTIFWPPSPANQKRPSSRNFQLCIFYPIWMKFGMGAIIGLKTT